MSFGNYIQTGDFKGEKHVPAIDAPTQVKAGELFNVAISIGKEIPHPNTVEHYIGNVSLYFKADGDKFAFLVGKVDFAVHGESLLGANQGPVHCDPHALFSVKLTKSGTFTAVSYCNLHGFWESEAKITVNA